MGGYGWGEVSREELIEAVHCAVEKGINFFDTADVYGLGESERTLGQAISGKRNEVIIATKFGARRDNSGHTYYDNSPEWIEQAVMSSLERLNTDYIDLYQVHYRDGKTSISSIVNTLEKLKQKGIIRYYGLSNITTGDIEEIKAIPDKFVSFQNEFSLANREKEKDILEIHKKLNISVLTWGSLGQGILSGKYKSDVKFDAGDRRSRDIYKNFHGEKLLHNLHIVEVINNISVNISKSISSIAIRWILDYLPDSVVIVGVKTPQQLKSNASALGWSLTEEQIKELDLISNY